MVQLVPTIVIIGGSFGGFTVAQSIDKALKENANVILVEEREAFYCSIAGLRAVVELDWIPHAWISYSNLFPYNKRSKTVQARARSVSKTHVVLSNGEELAFDYLVIATGARIPAPAGTLKTTRKEYVEELEKIQKAVTGARSVAIVGGGVIGVELAGEIATDFPEIKVTIIHGGKVLVDKLSPTASTTLKINAQLADLGVNVLLNTKVIPSYNKNTSLLPIAEATYNLSRATLKTSSGESIETDVQFVCTGIQKPNSDLAAGLKVLDDHGYIRVDSNGQVEGFTNIFALGDVSSLDELKLAYLTYRVQAPIISDNIISLIKSGSSAQLKRYKKAVPGQFAAISIGRFGGVLQTPLGTFGSWLTSNIKSHGLFLKEKYHDLHQPFGYVSPKFVNKLHRSSQRSGWIYFAVVVGLIAAAGSFFAYRK